MAKVKTGVLSGKSWSEEDGKPKLYKLARALDLPDVNSRSNKDDLVKAFVKATRAEARKKARGAGKPKAGAAKTATDAKAAGEQRAKEKAAANAARAAAPAARHRRRARPQTAAAPAPARRRPPRPKMAKKKKAKRKTPGQKESGFVASHRRKRAAKRTRKKGRRSP